MKTLFLQLSDMHCRESDNKFTEKIDKISPALNTLGRVDKVVLIFSGDLTQSAAPNEFKTARKIIGRLLTNLGKKYNSHIPLLIVPGNHDLRIPQGDRTINEILKWNLDEHISEELERLDVFFEYANSKNCFRDSCKLFDIKEFECGNERIQANLLNSALFSTRRHDDKEVHYLPTSIESQLTRKPNIDVKISVIHHSFEWCKWETKNMLKKSFKEDDIVFVGHEHVPEMFTISDNSSNTNIIMGGVFNLEPSAEASFNAVLYDSNTQLFDCYKFNWFNQKNIFKSDFIGQILPKSTCSTLEPSASYLDNFLEDKSGISTRLTDYYVFPRLVPEKNEYTTKSAPKINPTDFFDLLKKHEIIRITSKKGYGKSALIKYLYHQSIQFGFYPLYIEKTSHPNRIERMIEDMFELQYGENKLNYEIYRQLEFSKRIIFIDDFDLIKTTTAQEKLFSYIISNGGLLVYTTSDNTEHNLEETVKKALNEKQIYALKITPLLNERREELVNKICSLNNFQHYSGSSSHIVSALDYMVQNQASLFPINPGNIIQFIKFYLTGTSQEDFGTKTLSLVYETNIRNSILKCIKPPLATIYLSALEYLAHYLYFTIKSEYIHISTLEMIINEFNHSRKTSINTKAFLETCKKAKILEELPTSLDLCFSDKNTLAYFVAKAINRNLERDPQNVSNIVYIMQHICFGINDSIVLFLSYIRNSSRIILKIASSTNEILNKYDELDFDQNNIPFLTTYRTKQLSVPSQKDRQEHTNNIEKIEETRQESVSFQGIFDYNEEDVEHEDYRILRALKYTQLIGRFLLDQFGVLEEDELNSIIQSLYSNPQKILYAIFKPYQDNQDTIVANLTKYGQERFPNDNINSDLIRKIFTDAGIVLTLNVMNDIAYNSSNSSTIHVLNQFELKNSNYKLQNLMALDNVGHSNVFIDRIIELNKEYKNNIFIQSLLSQIARKHLLSQKNLPYDLISKLVSAKILTEENKKSLLLEKYNSKNK